MLPSFGPPPGWAGEFSSPYMVKEGPQIIVLCVQRAHPRDRYLTELAGQDVGLTSPLFYCLRACLILLSHGFVAKQARFLK